MACDSGSRTFYTGNAKLPCMDMGSPCWRNSQEVNAGRLQPSEQGGVADEIRNELPEKGQMWTFELIFYSE